MSKVQLLTLLFLLRGGRLAWKWLNSHLFGSWISIEVTEMLMAHLFHNPAPYAAPNTPLIAFYRWPLFLSFFLFSCFLSCCLLVLTM
jgi:hypothetical protein